jgi:hypothetical protein
VVLTSHRIEPDRPATSWSTTSYKVSLLAPCPVMLVK